METIPEPSCNIAISQYDYELPEDRIAQYPLSNRDDSKLLVFRRNKISSDSFKNIDQHIPGNSLLVFNNTKVIKARLLFKKTSGAAVEVFCLEPLIPYNYEESFASESPVEWKCIVGNLKKWKSGRLGLEFRYNNNVHHLYAEKIRNEGDAMCIKFIWDNGNLTFSEVIEACGHVPLPPYIDREDVKADRERYQTIYSAVSGSVAAPTAGLHFTDGVLQKLAARGARKAFITLHVGAGTFLPVRADNILDHDMHCEHFLVTRETIRLLAENQGRIIAVGTTSVRTLESLYLIGVKIFTSGIKSNTDMVVEQWEPYSNAPEVTVGESLAAIEKFMTVYGLSYIRASTKLFIVPGFKFRLTDGLLTNFHQPRSTLLLLVSAWTGPAWKEIYRYALENEFRFLSYGDSSLLFSSIDK
jgi:S-adenosylmethionine:tRNA ribosyltransferase-isomerase